MRNSNQWRNLAVAAAVSQALLSSATQAQQAAQQGAVSDNVLQEVVVTATRRSERLQDVPVSVATFSQEAIDQKGLRSIDDLSRLSPGVDFQRSGLSGSFNDEQSDIAIRGIDSSAGAPTTGIYIDDTPVMTRSIGFTTANPYPALFDLERVEVLRGPQGTLFGAGSEGGTVRFITPDPGLQNYSGYVRSEWGSTKNGSDSYEFGAAFGGPLIDDVLGFRASASYRRDGGYVNRVDYSTGDVVDANSNWHNTTTARLALKWQVMDGLSISPSVFYQELRINDTAAYWASLSNAGSTDFNNGNAGPDSAVDPWLLSALKITWTLGGVDLLSNTSYLNRRQHAQSDYAAYNSEIFLGEPYPDPTDQAPVYTTDTQRNFYQEIRLQSNSTTSPLSWTGGLFYAHMDENSAENVYDYELDSEMGGALCGPGGCPGGLLNVTPIDRVIDKQAAVFGEVSYKFATYFKATAGVRVEHAQYDAQAYSAGILTPNGSTTSQESGKENPVTPKAVLSYQPTADDLYYLSATKGYRVGGTNSPQPSTCAPSLEAAGFGADGQPPSTYGSDHVWSYEIGAKNTVLDHSLQVNSSLYWVDWTGIQQNVYLPSCGSFYTANLGKVRSLGGDVEVLYRPYRMLTLDFSAAYGDAKYTQSVAAIAGTNIVSEGDRLPGAPWTFVASAEQLFPAIGNNMPYVRIDYQHTTAQTALLPSQDPRNALIDTTIPGLPITNNLNLRAGLRFDGFDVSLYGNNITNSLPLMVDSRVAATPGDTLYWQRSVRPRTLGVTLTYRY